MSDQVPLYLGIPLAMLCIAAVFAVTVFAVAMWKDWRSRK